MGRPRIGRRSVSQSPAFAPRIEVVCRICHQDVDKVIPHLLDTHPDVDVRGYLQQFPNDVYERPTTSIAAEDLAVSDAEAAAHPGGRDGVLIERTLDPAELEGFRRDVQTLLDADYPAGYTVVSAAYLMTLARRSRREHERLRRTAQVTDSDHLLALERLETRLRDVIKELDKARLADLEASRAQDEKADPLAVLEEELARTDLWVEAHQGEFTERCPGCGQNLILPAVPHWAYAPIDTKDGRQWPVWSPELWKLVGAGILTLGQMAYALRTSPEALSETARRRGEEWPRTLDLEVEERWLRRWLSREDRAAQQGSGDRVRLGSGRGVSDDATP